MSRKYNKNYKEESVCRVIHGQAGVVHDCLSTQFPNGLRVLLVDDDPVCLFRMESLIRTLDYKVTSCQEPKVALEIIRQNKDVFDIAVIDIHMPDMNGIELLQHVQVEVDLPVVMMSADDKPELVLEGVLCGACDYLIKPVTLESLKTIWQHVLRKKGCVFRRLAQPRDNHEDVTQVRSLTDSCRVAHRTIPGEHKGNPTHLKRKRDEDFEDESKAYSEDAAKGKRRMVWTPDLHEKFLEAVNYLGDKAVPIKILECMQRMNVPGVTRENIASHLQKYRLSLRKVDESSEQKNRHHLPSSCSNGGAFFEENLLLGRRNFKRGEGSSRFPMQSLITGSRFPLHDQSCTPFHSIPQASYYPPLAVSFPPHNFPCINSTEASAPSNILSPFVISTPNEVPENRGEVNIEQLCHTLPVFDFDGTEGGDTSPQLIDEPSLYHRYFDKNEFFPEPGPNDVVDEIDLAKIGNRVCDSPTGTS